MAHSAEFDLLLQARDTFTMDGDSDIEMSTDGPSGDADEKLMGKKCKEKCRFEVKKWNACALWAWDIVVDNCAICRNHIMDLCIECQDELATKFF